MSAAGRRGQVLAVLVASPLIAATATAGELVGLADALLAAAVPAAEMTRMDEALRAELASTTGTAWATTTERTERRWAA